MAADFDTPVPRDAYDEVVIVPHGRLWRFYADLRSLVGLPNHYRVCYRQDLLDEDPLTDEDLVAVREAEEAIARGDYEVWG